MAGIDLRSSAGASDPNLLDIGEEVFSREFISSVATGPAASGQLRLTFFTARKSETTTQVRVITGSTAAGATPTLCRIGLWSVDASNNGTLVAATTNDTALFAAANTAYTRTWAASYAKVAGQRYALGVLVVTGAAMPTFAGQLVPSAAEYVVTPTLNALIAGQADLAAFTGASLVASGSRVYGAVF